MNKKYLELEFDNDVTYDEIKEEFNYYKRIKQLVMTKINGYAVFSDSENLEEDIFKAIHQVSEEELQEIKDLDQQKTIEERLLINSVNIEYDELYKYYIGLSELFIVSEKIEHFKRFMIDNYVCPTKYSIARLISSLLLILEEEDMHSLYLQLNMLFLSVQNNDDKADLSIALGIVKKYGKKGNKLDEIMFSDSIKDFVNREKRIIKTLENKIAKLTDK